MQPINILPLEFQKKWMAHVKTPLPTDKGIYRLVQIRPTRQGYMTNRIVVVVLDENERPIPGIDVVFAFSTGNQVILEGDWQWQPPHGGRLGDVVTTRGDGMAEHIQGSAVKEGQPGGITVWILDQERSSAIVDGLGMLADHTGVYMVFQRFDEGIRPDAERLLDLEMRVLDLENRVAELEARCDAILRPSVVRYESND